MSSKTLLAAHDAHRDARIALLDAVGELEAVIANERRSPSELDEAEKKLSTAELAHTRAKLAFERAEDIEAGRGSFERVGANEMRSARSLATSRRVSASSVTPPRSASTGRSPRARSEPPRPPALVV